MIVPLSIQVTAILLTGLIAGLFYSFDCAVVKGLGKLPDKEYIGAFKQINTAIQNPYFFISFMGSLVILPVAAWVSYGGVSSTSFYLMLSATIVYIIGVFGITAFGNVPLNNLLDQFNLTNASDHEIHSMRQKFEEKWNGLNRTRTFASILCFLLSIFSSLL